MGKISPVSAKYIVHATIDIEGIVDRPDVIGAIFGQTEGLLGSELELRELQRSGRIGRIEVEVDTRSGKTHGTILIPSSLDKAETSIVAAALEIIQRIGPCNAKIHVQKIEDVRISKRNFVIERAKTLLKNMIEGVMPDSQELADEVAYSVRVMEIQEYGKDRLPAGPNIDDNDEIIIVEGRADVLNLLKHGIKNVIALNGTSVPETIIELSKKKIVTIFVDGDRGGDLIIKEMMNVADVDYVTKAPDGKEVEELTKKEIHKALRNKVAPEQEKIDASIKAVPDTRKEARPVVREAPRPATRPVAKAPVKKAKMTEKEKKSFREMLDDLIGTRGAYILDGKLNILGKVPTTELATTIKSLSSGVYAVILDGIIDKDLVQIAERTGVSFLVGMDTKVPQSPKLNIIVSDNL